MSLAENISIAGGIMITVAAWFVNWKLGLTVLGLWFIYAGNILIMDDN